MNTNDRFSRGGGNGGRGGNRSHRGNRNRNTNRGGPNGYMNNMPNQPKMDNYCNDTRAQMYPMQNVGNCYIPPNDFSNNHIFSKLMNQTLSAQFLTQQQQFMQQQQQIQQMQHHMQQQMQQQQQYQFSEFPQYEQQPILVENQSVASSGDYPALSVPSAQFQTDNSSINSNEQNAPCCLDKNSPTTEPDSGYAEAPPNEQPNNPAGGVRPHFMSTDWFINQQPVTPFRSQALMELSMQPFEMNHLAKYVEDLPVYMKDSKKVLNRSMQLSYIGQVFARDYDANQLGNFSEELKDRKILDWFRLPEFVECFQAFLLSYAYCYSNRNPAPFAKPASLGSASADSSSANTLNTSSDNTTAATDENN